MKSYRLWVWCSNSQRKLRGQEARGQAVTLGSPGEEEGGREVVSQMQGLRSEQWADGEGTRADEELARVSVCKEQAPIPFLQTHDRRTRSSWGEVSFMDTGAGATLRSLLVWCRVEKIQAIAS